MKARKLILALLIFTLGYSDLRADSRTVPVTQGVRVEGRREITVNHPVIRLSDIAAVSSTFTQDDDAVIALQKIVIERSPAAGQEMTLSASTILDRMKEEGVALSELTYVLPRIVKVKRAHRELTMDEVQRAMKTAMKQSGRQAELSQISYTEPISVPPATEDLKAKVFQTSKPGVLGFDLTASVPNEEPIKFQVTAQVEEWINIPIASRPISRGEIIQDQDLMMARVNISALPNDSMYRAEEIVGKRVENDIQHGEAFRKNKIVTPPVIEVGNKVVLIYRVGLLEATATGIAMEAGPIGQEIKVRNDASKRVLTGKVLEAGQVEIKQ